MGRPCKCCGCQCTCMPWHLNLVDRTQWDKDDQGRWDIPHFGPSACKVNWDMTNNAGVFRVTENGNCCNERPYNKCAEDMPKGGGDGYAKGDWSGYKWLGAPVEGKNCGSCDGVDKTPKWNNNAVGDDNISDYIGPPTGNGWPLHLTSGHGIESEYKEPSNPFDNPADAFHRPRDTNWIDRSTQCIRARKIIKMDEPFYIEFELAAHVSAQTEQGIWITKMADNLCVRNTADKRDYDFCGFGGHCNEPARWPDILWACDRQWIDKSPFRGDTGLVGDAFRNYKGGDADIPHVCSDPCFGPIHRNCSSPAHSFWKCPAPYYDPETGKNNWSVPMSWSDDINLYHFSNPAEWMWTHRVGPARDKDGDIIDECGGGGWGGYFKTEGVMRQPRNGGHEFVKMGMPALGYFSRGKSTTLTGSRWDPCLWERDTSDNGNRPPRPAGPCPHNPRGGWDADGEPLNPSHAHSCFRPGTQLDSNAPDRPRTWEESGTDPKYTEWWLHRLPVLGAVDGPTYGQRSMYAHPYWFFSWFYTKEGEGDDAVWRRDEFESRAGADQAHECLGYSPLKDSVKSCSAGISDPSISFKWHLQSDPYVWWHSWNNEWAWQRDPDDDSEWLWSLIDHKHFRWYDPGGGTRFCGTIPQRTFTRKNEVHYRTSRWTQAFGVSFLPFDQTPLIKHNLEWDNGEWGTNETWQKTHKPADPSESSGWESGSYDCWQCLTCDQDNLEPTGEKYSGPTAVWDHGTDKWGPGGQPWHDPRTHNGYHKLDENGIYTDPSWRCRDVNFDASMCIWLECKGVKERSSLLPAGCYVIYYSHSLKAGGYPQGVPLASDNPVVLRGQFEPDEIIIDNAGEFSIDPDSDAGFWAQCGRGVNRGIFGGPEKGCLGSGQHHQNGSAGQRYSPKMAGTGGETLRPTSMFQYTLLNREGEEIDDLCVDEFPAERDNQVVKLGYWTHGRQRSLYASQWPDPSYGHEWMHSEEPNPPSWPYPGGDVGGGARRNAHGIKEAALTQPCCPMSSDNVWCNRWSRGYNMGGPDGGRFA